jgi:undecaprenyl-diphosphatase
MQWSDSLWRTFACYRFDMKGARREPMTIQWAASADDLRTALRDAGWAEGPQISVRSVLSLVAPNVDVMSLPLLPKLNNGLPSPLVFARARLAGKPGDAGEPGSRRDVLRFWPSGYALAPRRNGNGSGDGHASDGEPTPIWVGSLVHERLRRGSWPFNVVTTYPDDVADLSAPGQPAGWRTLALPGEVSCEGRPVKLIVQGGR